MVVALADNPNFIMIRNRLLIVSAGDFGREVLSWAMQVPESNRDWEIGGFLDDRNSILDGYNLPYSIIGTPYDHPFSENDRVVVAVGSPSMRKIIALKLRERGAIFTTLIHPTTIIGMNNSWGEGCILCPGATLTTNIRIGNHVVFNANCGAGHDVVVGDYCTISGGANVTGRVQLGNEVMVGSNATFVPGVNVGDAAVIGAGSVVLRNVPPHTTVMGVPAVEIWTSNQESI
jgi:sugar O-acyltransferase (sialic acid O-acetyltransferase NeuD family)